MNVRLIISAAGFAVLGGLALTWIAVSSEGLRSGRGEADLAARQARAVAAQRSAGAESSARPATVEVAESADRSTARSGGGAPKSAFKGDPIAHDSGLAAIDGIVKMMETDPVRTREFLAVDDTWAVVAAMIAEPDALASSQLRRLELVDEELSEREFEARLEERLSTFRAVRDQVLAGEGEWFPIAEARSRTLAALERTEADRADRHFMSFGGPVENTSRIVQVFRWDYPECFAKDAEHRRVHGERRAVLRGELERMGVKVLASTAH